MPLEATELPGVRLQDLPKLQRGKRDLIQEGAQLLARQRDVAPLHSEPSHYAKETALARRGHSR